MKTEYTEVTAIDCEGHTFKITCYRHVLTLLHQVEDHYKELYKNQYCKDNNIDRVDLVKHAHLYLLSEYHKAADAFSMGNIGLSFESETLNLSNYDHTIMDEDDVIEIYQLFKGQPKDPAIVMLELHCSEENFLAEERSYHKKQRENRSKN